MKIHSLSYKDNVQKWGISKIHFFNLTLLVGVSGVGKTQILSAILKIQEIANGESLNGVEWIIEFSHENNNYRWTGEFEVVDDFKSPFKRMLMLKEKRITPKMLKEKIYLNNELIAKRENNKIQFQGATMPKLASEESLISIFKEEDKIKSVYDGFKKIIFKDHATKDKLQFSFINYETLNEEYKTLDEIRNSDLDTRARLIWIYQNQKEIFNEIVASYKDIFPQIEDVKIESIKHEEEKRLVFLSTIPIIQFKEEGVDKWIFEDENVIRDV